MSFRFPTIVTIIAVLFMLPAFTSNAATSISIGDTLGKISRQMYAEQNEYFILVEAMKDGLIEDGKHYLFEYAPSGISINGRKLVGEQESRYRKLLQDFYSNGVTAKAPESWRVESDSLSIKDLLNPTSSFRTRGPWVHTNRKPTRLLIIEELARDGIADTAAGVRLVYTLQALTVNGQLIPPAHQDKYKTLIRILDGFMPTKESDIYSISH